MGMRGRSDVLLWARERSSNIGCLVTVREGEDRFITARVGFIIEIIFVHVIGR